MKVKTIELKYTTGKDEVITPETPGFLVTGARVYPTDAWSMNDAYQAVATVLLSTMSATVDNYGGYAPLFDKLNEVIKAVKVQLAPKTEAKEFAFEFQKNFLHDEIMEDQKLPKEKRKYDDLFAKMSEFTKKAAERLTDASSGVQLETDSTTDSSDKA